MNEAQFFEYGAREIEYLQSKDAILGAAIDEIGHIDRQVIPDLFMALVNSIVGQQISTKAHATVWERMQTRFAPLTPPNIAAISAESLQTCGISMRKALYIKEIAETVEGGRLDLTGLKGLSDDEVCKQLCQIKGVGIWTAEMLITFSMQRQNVMNWDDLAIQRGMRMLYRHRTITPALFAKYKRRYSPFATVASLYLWAIAGGWCKNLTDCAPRAKSKKT